MKFLQPEYQHYAFDSHKRSRVKEMFNDDSLTRHYVDNHMEYFQKYGANRKLLKPNNKYGKSSIEIQKKIARSQEDIWLICQLVRMAHDQYINGRWSIKIRHEDLKLIQGIEAHLHANSKLDIRKHIHPLTQVLLDIYYGPNTDTGKTPHKYSY